MKQHITIDQINELSSDKRSGIYKFWATIPDDERMLTRTHPADGSLPLLSIGQMIDLLHTNHERVDIHDSSPTDSSLRDWLVVARSGQYNDRELCDALWEATKEVLERE